MRKDTKSTPNPDPRAPARPQRLVRHRACRPIAAVEEQRRMARIRLGTATRPAAAPTGPGTRASGLGSVRVGSGPSPSGRWPFGGRLAVRALGRRPIQAARRRISISPQGRRRREPGTSQRPHAQRDQPDRRSQPPDTVVAAAPAASPAPTPAPRRTPAEPALRGAAPAFDLSSGDRRPRSSAEAEDRLRSPSGSQRRCDGPEAKPAPAPRSDEPLPAGPAAMKVARRIRRGIRRLRDRPKKPARSKRPSTEPRAPELTKALCNGRRGSRPG